MKFIANCICLLASTLIYGQSTIIHQDLGISAKQWSTETILKELFDGTYIDSLNCIKWKPFPGEVIEISFDGFCYSTVDSVYTFSNDSSNKRVVVIKTSSFKDDNFLEMSNAEASTMSVALFSQENNFFKLINFNRSVILTGHGGYLGQIEILNLGNDFLVLLLKESESHEIDLHQYFFSLNNSNFGMNVFSLKSFRRIIDSNEDVYNYEFSEFLILKNNPEDTYPKIEITKSITTIKEDIESTEIISKTTLEYDGFGFY